MSERWTPGPWRAVPFLNNWDVMANKNWTLLTSSFTSDDAIDEEQDKANAALAAASPDLYSALEDLLKGGEHEGECDFSMGEIFPCILHKAAREARKTKAREALAKARGESPDAPK